MKAIEITQPGGPEVLKPVERPVPEPGPGEVLIKVTAAGVNRPDVFQRMGLYPAPEGASDIPGLEVSGRVAALGEGVTEFQEGEPVCALVTGGGYAEYCVAPVETCLYLPEGLDEVAAGGVPETFYTVWSNMFDRAELKQDETLLIHGGTSGIGTTAIQLAKSYNVTVITTVGSDEKAAFCRDELGADLAINYKTQDFVAETKAFTKDRGVDVVLDMIGGDYVARNIACMAEEGRHVSIAFLGGSKVSLDMGPVMRKRLVLTGSTLRARDNGFKGAIAGKLRVKVWPLIEQGMVTAVVDRTFPLDRAADAHAYLDEGKHRGKVILTL
ncbi:NAD(P)H-quinone oxidoreductase [Yunchengibacter salinarum]|uniref:NAD(P)H-quinone oxidoreductase n=1 Tax=Yunchengibacter salinarum TaxID=3133399 RepID=UPI0035B68ABD